MHFLHHVLGLALVGICVIGSARSVEIDALGNQINSGVTLCQYEPSSLADAAFCSGGVCDECGSGCMVFASGQSGASGCMTYWNNNLASIDVLDTTGADISQKFNAIVEMGGTCVMYYSDPNGGDCSSASDYNQNAAMSSSWDGYLFSWSGGASPWTSEVRATNSAYGGSIYGHTNRAPTTDNVKYNSLGILNMWNIGASSLQSCFDIMSTTSNSDWQAAFNAWVSGDPADSTPVSGLRYAVWWKSPLDCYFGYNQFSGSADPREHPNNNGLLTSWSGGDERMLMEYVSNNPMCDTYTCTSGNKLANDDIIECSSGTCDDATCCYQPVMCDSHTCAAGVNIPGVECPGGTCDEDTCCGFPYEKLEIASASMNTGGGGSCGWSGPNNVGPDFKDTPLLAHNAGSNRIYFAAGATAPPSGATADDIANYCLKALNARLDGVFLDADQKATLDDVGGIFVAGTNCYFYKGFGLSECLGAADHSAYTRVDVSFQASTPDTGDWLFDPDWTSGICGNPGASTGHRFYSALEITSLSSFDDGEDLSELITDMKSFCHANSAECLGFGFSCSNDETCPTQNNRYLYWSENPSQASIDACVAQFNSCTVRGSPDNILNVASCVNNDDLSCLIDQWSTSWQNKGRCYVNKNAGSTPPPTCNLYTCTAGVKKADDSSIVCTTGTCDDATCCDNPMCDTYTCVGTAPYTKKANDNSIECTLGHCNDATCCDAPSGSADLSSFTTQELYNEYIARTSNTCT